MDRRACRNSDDWNLLEASRNVSTQSGAETFIGPELPSNLSLYRKKDTQYPRENVTERSIIKKGNDVMIDWGCYSSMPLLHHLNHFVKSSLF